jgi:hypothetical protein
MAGHNKVAAGQRPYLQRRLLPSVGAPLKTMRRRTRVPTTAVAVLVLLLAGCGAGTSGRAGPSCVAPFLAAGQTASPPAPGHPAMLGEVHPGQSVTIYGYWYFDGSCADSGESSPLSSHSRRPASSISLSLTTADRHRTELGIAHPNSDASFTATLTIPADSSPGPASIGDGPGDEVELMVLAR